MNRIRKIKRFIKISVATFVILLAIVLAFFVDYQQNFENSNMTKWNDVSESQRVSILRHIVKKDDVNRELLIACINKIATLPDASEMMIRDAVSLCYNGIKLNENTDDNEDNK